MTRMLTIKIGNLVTLLFPQQENGVLLFVHNKIAEVGDDFANLMVVGNLTTKSRLNAINVLQCYHRWCLRRLAGSFVITMWPISTMVTSSPDSFFPYLTTSCQSLSFFFTVNFIVQMVGLWTTVWVTLKRQKRMRLLHVIDSILTLLFHTLRLKIDQN